jgi:hypothetical protein
VLVDLAALERINLRAGHVHRGGRTWCAVRHDAGGAPEALHVTTAHRAHLDRIALPTIGRLALERVALSDMCTAAVRPGSLHTAIVHHTVEADDFAGFLARHRPSFGGRRMAETAALLTDRVLPAVPLRQWVLSLPFPLRLLLAVNPAALTGVLDHSITDRIAVGPCAGRKALTTAWPWPYSWVCCPCGWG